MKKKIFTVLFNEITIFFILTSFTLTIIVWILQAVNFLDIVSEDGHSLLTYFYFSLLNIPKIFTKLIILTYFLTIYYILNLYEDKNQILIFWMNGISKLHFIKNLISFSIFFVLFSFMFSFFVVPYTQDKARSFIRNSNLDFFPSLIKPRKFVDTVEDLTIFLEYKNNNLIKNILLKDENDKSSQLILAKSGEIINEMDKKYIKLDNGVIINYGKNKNLNSFNFEETILNLSGYKTKTTIHPKIQEISSTILIKCIKNLNSNINREIKIKNLNCNKNLFKNLVSEIYKRTYLHVYLPLLTIVAAFLVLKSSNSKNYNQFKIKTFLVGIFFVVISQISIDLVSKNILTGGLVIVFPILSILFSYVFFLKKMKTSF